MGLMALLEKVINKEVATVTVATPTTVKQETPPSVATVATIAVASTPKLNIEPHTSTYTKRLQSFQSKGISSREAHALAAKLDKRDADFIDDRISCAECAHYHAGRCGKGVTLIGETSIFSLVRCKEFKND
ncbi:hypothetical protein GCM10011450_02280 [Advenella faeciporci]|uniref:Uncharacterized protein n=1 Tax=Advenella faeciporci TaxID=797535 RepID=A0A918JEC2_9BURK|nr:hypothetical protein [Advenella faeciporci]GGW76221.1 hypothetical protein GCM10011450_02280 [Advenella faeciporci]